MAHTRPQSGFTLIELSIVLVIIGLVAGGVLVGRELIKAAEYRKIATQLESFNAAINTFKVKYNCLPGDCNTATQFFPDTDNGDGDGYLQVDSTETYAFTPIHRGGLYEAFGFEYAYIWEHLGASKLIPGEYDGSPTKGKGFPVTFDNVGIVATLQNTVSDPANQIGHFFVVGTADTLAGPLYSNGNFKRTYTQQDLFVMDTKYDDGLPKNGIIMAWYINTTITGPDSYTITISRPETYELNTNLKLNLYYKMQGFNKIE